LATATPAAAAADDDADDERMNFNVA